MFKIQLDAIASTYDSVITVAGKVITIDGVAVDLSAIAEGEQCEADRPIVGLVKCEGGAYHLTVEYHYDTATAEPEQSADRNDYAVTIKAGQVPDVIRRRPVPEPVQEGVDQDAEVTE